MPDSFKVPWIKSFSALDLHRHFRTSVHARTRPTFAAVVLPSLQLTITLTLAVQKSGLILQHGDSLVLPLSSAQDDFSFK